MSELGTASVRIVPNTTGLTSSSFRSRMAKIGKLAGLALAGGFVIESKKAIETTQDLTKSTISLHKNLGLTNKVASEWAGVAKARGADTTKLGMAFKTLATQISNAGHGSKSSIAIFKELGFSQKDIHRAVTDTEFGIKKVADGLHALPAGADKATFSSKLFGRGWQTIAPILRDGSAAMQEQLDTVQKYGGVLEGKTLKQQENLLANLRENKIAWQGMQIQLATFLTPTLNKVSNQFQKIAKINADPNLTGEEKWKRISHIIETDFDDALNFVTDKLLPEFASRMGEAGPKIAGALIQGFMNANVWGKLFIGGFLATKLAGAFGGTAMGKTAATNLTRGLTRALPFAIGAAGIANIVTSATKGDWKDAGFEAGGALAGGIAGAFVGGPAGAMLGAGIGSVLGEALSGVFGGKHMTALESALKMSAERLTKSLHAERGALAALAGASDRVAAAHRRQHRATAQLNKAEEHLANVRGRYPANSRPVIEAEHRVAKAKEGDARATKAVQHAERLHGAELWATRKVLHGVATDEKTRIEALKQSRQHIEHQITAMRKEGYTGDGLKDVLSRLAKNQDQTKKAQDAYSKTLINAAQKVGPKFANSLKQIKVAFGDLGDASKKVKQQINASFRGVPPVADKAFGVLIDDTNQALKAFGSKKHVTLNVPGKQMGGMVVPGLGSGDTVPLHIGGQLAAMVEPRELVSVTNRTATDALMRHNAAVPRRADGGLVRPQIGGSPGVLRALGQSAIDEIFQSAKAYLKKHKGSSGHGAFKGNVSGIHSAAQFIPFWDKLNPRVKSFARAFSMIVPRESSWDTHAGGPGSGNPTHAGWYQFDAPTYNEFGKGGWPAGAYNPTSATIAAGNVAKKEGWRGVQSRWAQTYVGKMRGGIVRKLRRGGVVGGDEPGPRRRKLGALARGGGGAAIENTEPRTLNRLIAVANKVNAAHFAYKWGGGHENPANFEPFDCSGVTSYLLQQSGFPIATDVAQGFMSKFHSGAGKDFTIYASPSHVYSVIAGRGFGTSSGNDTGWFSGGARSGFVARHPDLASTGSGGGAGTTPKKKPKLKLTKKQQARLDKLTKKLKTLGLPKKAQGKINAWTDDWNRFDEWAGFADELNSETDSGQTILANFRGHDEVFWLTQEFQRLFQIRNFVLQWFNTIGDQRKKVGAQLARVQKSLEQLQKIKHPNKGQRRQIKFLTAEGKQLTATASALDGKIGSLVGTDGTLTELQGRVGGNDDSGLLQPQNGITPSQAVHRFGGQIFDVAKRLVDLGASSSVTGADTGTGTDSGLADLLRQQLQEKSLAYLTSQAQYDVFRNMPSFGGGGIVDGPRGTPRRILAHGDEGVFTPEQMAAMGGSGDNYFHIDPLEGKVREISREEYQRAGKRRSRKVDSRLPGRGGGLQLQT